MQDLITPEERLNPLRNKYAAAVAYLRERGIYCLDQPVRRLPATKRQPTILDRWLSKRGA